MHGDFMVTLQDIPEAITSQKWHMNMGLLLSNNGDMDIWNSHLWPYDNPLRTAESNFQHSIPVNVWCSVVGDQLIEYVNMSDRWHL
jgi:hypothetical protein